MFNNSFISMLYKDFLLYEKNNNFYVIISCIIGFIIGGMFFPTWQHAVESAQVISHIVTYPNENNPFYIYHIYSISVYNHVIAFFLKYTSEIFVSVFLSCIQGGLSYFAISFFIKGIVGRESSIILFVPLIAHFTGISELPVPYQILMMGDVGYGGIALSLFILSGAFFINGNYNSLAVLLGFFFPIIHPALAALSHLAIFTSIILNILFNKSNKIKLSLANRSVLIYLLAIFCVFIVFYFLFSGVFSHIKFNDLDRDITLRFINDWSTHHRDFPFLSGSGLVFVFYFLCLFCVFIYRFVQKKESNYKLLNFLFVISFFGVVASLLSHGSTSFLPLFFWQLMPVRIPNITILLVPCLLLVLFFKFVDFKFVLFISSIFVVWHVVFNSMISPFVFLILIFSIVLCNIFISTNSIFRISMIFNKYLSSNVKPYIFLFFIVFIFSGLYIISYGGLRGNIWGYIQEKAFFDKVKKYVPEDKYVLTGGMELIQLKSQRPVSTTHAFNQGLYLPSTWKPLLKTYFDYYHVVPSDLNRMRAGTLHPGLYQEYWSRLTLFQWRNLSKKFNIGGVIAYKGWKLDMPLVARSNDYNLYLPNIKDTRPKFINKNHDDVNKLRSMFSLSSSYSVFWEDKVPASFSLEYKTPTFIKGYYMKNIDAPGRMPAEWIVETSEDGINWFQVAHIKNQTYIKGQAKEFLLNKLVDRFIRFKFIKVGNSDDILRIYDFYLKGGCPSGQVLDDAFGNCYSIKNSTPIN